jgi:hypothetical protein
MNPSQRFTVSSRHKWICGVLLSFTALCGCGGGGGAGGGGGGQTPGDFSLSVSPASISVPAGGSAPISVTATAFNGFSGQVSVLVSGLPTGVQASPSSVVLTPGTAQTVTLNAASNAPQATASVSFNGTSSSLQHTASLSLSIIPGGNGVLPTRTKYIRTDAVTEYYLWVNSHWTVYHMPTAHFFVADPFSNQVFVIDPRTQSEVGTISVPGAYGIDQTPDGSTLWVGTLIGDLYAIDPAALAVKHRYIASEIGPYGFQAISALALADDRLALLGQQGGIPSVDGSSAVAVWNPTDNSITFYGSSPAPGAPASPLCNFSNGHIFGFALTSDRTSLLTGSGNALCELNPSTGQSLSASSQGNADSITVSPDGKYIALPNYGTGVVLIDQKTLNQVAQFSVAGDTSSTASFTFSPDSKTLFVNSSSFVYAYDVASHQQIGWIPNIVVTYTSGGGAVGPIYNPNWGVFDATGLMVGPLEEGFGFLDTTQLHTGTTGNGFLNAYLNPATGPESGGTVTQWSAPTPSQVYFGKSLASLEPGTGDLISVITPSGQPGPADVYLFLSDGEMQLIPEGFSYGPTILEVSPNYSTADGGGAGVIYGYGFGPLNATSVPSRLSVTVGGQSATITGFNPNTYNVLAQPFPLQSIYYKIPPGTAGNASDVSVTSSSETTTEKAAMKYLPALKQYSLAGASLVQGVYDPYHDVYYFTDSNKVQVFSLSQGVWLNPINVPLPQGATQQRLWGIALSADGSKLVVSDAQAGAVYLLNPASPASVQTFPIKPSGWDGGSGILVLPAGLAITNSGVVWLTVDVQGGTGYHNFFTLDTNTGTLTDLGIDGPGLGATDFALRVSLSADNTRIYFNNDGYVFTMDTATNSMVSASVDPGCCYGDYDLAIAPNQTQVEATSYLYDSNLNGVSTFALNDREIQDASYVYGVKFSPDGSLLFQPSVQGVDIYDGRVGNLRARVSLPVPLSTNYDALVSDGKDNILIAITGTTGNGIAVVDLSSLLEPAPLPYSAIESSQARVVADSVTGAISRGSTGSNSIEPTTRPRKVPHVSNRAFFPK